MTLTTKFHEVFCHRQNLCSLIQPFRYHPQGKYVVGVWWRNHEWPTYHWWDKSYAQKWFGNK